MEVCAHACHGLHQFAVCSLDEFKDKISIKQKYVLVKCCHLSPCSVSQENKERSPVHHGMMCKPSLEMAQQCHTLAMSSLCPPFYWNVCEISFILTNPGGIVNDMSTFTRRSDSLSFLSMVIYLAIRSSL